MEVQVTITAIVASTSINDYVYVNKIFLPLIKSPIRAADCVSTQEVLQSIPITLSAIKSLRIEFYHDGKWYEQSATGCFIRSGYDIDFPEDKE